jgi:hypothetical protein
VTRHQRNKVNNFVALKMGPVLATEGELHHTKTHYHCRWCVKGNDARAGVSNDRKRINNGAVG